MKLLAFLVTVATAGFVAYLSWLLAGSIPMPAWLPLALGFTVLCAGLLYLHRPLAWLLRRPDAFEQQVDALLGVRKS